MSDLYGDRTPTHRLRTIALALFLALLASGPQGGCSSADPADALAEIHELQKARDFAGSIEPLRALIKERPDDPELNYLYGRALVVTGQPSLASWALGYAMEDPEWRIRAGNQLAHAALMTGDYNEAVDVATRVLEHHPDEVTALLFRAQAHAHWKKDPSLALTDAERVLELEPEMLEAYEPLILALIALDRPEEATEALAEAGRRMSATEGSKSTLAWHCSTTAIFAQDAGDLDGARAAWEECLVEYPDNPTVVANAVQFFQSGGELDRSIEILRIAQAAAPGDRGFRTELADRLRFIGEEAEGEALLREATDVEDPRVSAAAWADLATYRHAMREHGAAADALARAISRIREVEEPSPQTLFEYADALIVSKQLGLAREVAEQSTVAAHRHLLLGRIAQEQGDPAAAMAQFDQALPLWPNNAFARYYTALAAETLGNFDRALEEYRYAIRVSVGATDARTRAARLLIAEGQPMLAYQLLFLEVEKSPLEPEGELLSMYLMARVANPTQLQQSLVALGQRDPARLPIALVRGANGAADRAGSKGALSLLRGAPGVDYTSPVAAPALRALVLYAHADGEPALAERSVAAAVAAHPDAGAIRSIQALHLQLAGAPEAEVRAAFERALALAPNDPTALSGLGQLVRDEDPVAAAALFDRAASADPSDPAPALAAARALRAAGRPAEASRKLGALLDAHPLQGDAAGEAAEIDLAQGQVTSRTLERARRAVRLGGGAEALERLSRVHAERNETAEAEAAADRARQLRERASTQPSKRPKGT